MKKRIFLLLLCLALLLTGCAASRRTPKQTFRIYGLSGAPGGGLRKIAGQRLAGAFLSLYAHGDEQTSGGQLCPHGIGLSGQRRLDLGRGGRFRQPFLRQLQNCQRAEAAQPLGVFRRSLGIKALFQLSHTDERDGKHKTSANPKSLSATDRLLDEKLSLLRRAAGRSDGRA